MIYLLLIFSVLVNSTKNILQRAGKNEFADPFRMYLMNAVAAIFSLAVVAMGGFASPPTIEKALFGVFYAAAALGSIVFYTKAVAIGSVTLSSLFYSMGFLFPTIFGAIFYKEEISLGTVIGILLILFSLFSSIDTRAKGEFSIKWLILAISASLCSGIIGIIQKIYRSTSFGEDINILLTISFALVVVLSLSAMPFNRKKFRGKLGVKFFVFAALIGLFVGIANKANLYLSGVMPSVIFFPSVNGGGIAATAIMSVLVFKENMTARKVASVILSVVGIIIVSVF